MMDSLVASISRTYFQRAPIKTGSWRVTALAGRILSNDFQAVVRLRDRLILELDASDFIQRTILLSGEYEPHVCRILEAHLRPGDVFFAIGANVGYLSLLAKRLVGPSGMVVAFEPNPVTATRLRRNAELSNADLRVFELALAEAPGQLPLHIDVTGNSGATSLKHGAGKPVEVAVETLDRVVEQYGLPPPRIIKMDIEGAEARAIRGMKAVLASRPLLLCEISEWSLLQMGDSKAALFELLQSYKPHLLEPPRVSAQASSGIHFQYDVLFVPEP